MSPHGDPGALIEEDAALGRFRVRRSVMTSEEIWRLEQERIFAHRWLFAGHESEVGRPGDFCRRTVGGRPIFMIRGADGVVRIFYNSCPHRGATICRQGSGNTKTLQCFYHSWTFSNSGALVALPDEEGYGSGFAREAMGLVRPPRHESYRGFHFVCYDPSAEPLDDYLGNARDYLDLVVDQSEQGLRVVPGSQKYVIRANWKLLVENDLDGYHAVPLHKTYFSYVSSLGGGVSMHGRGMGLARNLKGGHAAFDAPSPYGRPVARWDPLFGEASKDDIAALRASLVERHGEVKAFRMADTIRNLVVYPTLLVNDGVAVTVRMLEPLGPAATEVTAWALAPAEEPDSMLKRRLDSFLTFYGPGGFATPDDVEALESCQTAFATDLVWSDTSRGMHRVSVHTDEAHIRGFWRQWNAAITGGGPPDQSEASGPVDWGQVMRDWQEQFASRAAEAQVAPAEGSQAAGTGRGADAP